MLSRALWLLSEREPVMTDIFKSFASAMDRHIEIRRLVAEHQARVEKYKTENAKFLKSEKCQSQLHPGPDRLEWDHERTGPRVSDTQWDHNQARAEGWGSQVEIKQTS